MGLTEVEDTPHRLRQQAERLKLEAQASFSQAREAGEAPDRTLILAATRQAKELERRAMEIEDRSHTRVEEDIGNVSQAQLDSWADQALISAITEQLYISGYDAIQDDTCLKTSQITHILSVCRYHLPTSHQKEQYKCFSVPVLDTADQNILQYFNSCNEFIKSALDSGGKVLVHCHAGQSRSAAVLVAYLMQQDNVGVRSALDQIKRVRRVQPNDNFMNQLRLYSDCDYKVSEDNPLYRRWKFEAMNQALSTITAQDEHVDARGITGPVYQETDSSSKYTQIRCKKCRFVLASENHIIKHEPKLTPTTQPESQQSSLLPASCAHFFLEPIRWMKTELDRGELDGRFSCPNSKCGAKIGSYAWQGMTCSCRRWILPALCIQRSKVDELKSKTPAKVEPARKSVPKKS